MESMVFLIGGQDVQDLVPSYAHVLPKRDLFSQEVNVTNIKDINWVNPGSSLTSILKVSMTASTSMMTRVCSWM